MRRLPRDIVSFVPPTNESYDIRLQGNPPQSLRHVFVNPHDAGCADRACKLHAGHCPALAMICSRRDGDFNSVAEANS